MTHKFVFFSFGKETTATLNRTDRDSHPYSMLGRLIIRRSPRFCIPAYMLTTHAITGRDLHRQGRLPLAARWPVQPAVRQQHLLPHDGKRPASPICPSCVCMLLDGANFVTHDQINAGIHPNATLQHAKTTTVARSALSKLCAHTTTTCNAYAASLLIYHRPHCACAPSKEEHPKKHIFLYLST